MKIKAHSRKWKAWAKRMAHFCRHDACWIDPVCLWAKMHGCCPQHAPKAFGGWKYACRAVEEGEWTHVCRHPRLMHWWLEDMDEETRAHMSARGLPTFHARQDDALCFGLKNNISKRGKNG